MNGCRAEDFATLKSVSTLIIWVERRRHALTLAANVFLRCNAIIATRSLKSFNHIVLPMTSIVMVARLDEEGIWINVICLEQLFQVLRIHVYQNFATVFNK